MQDRLACLALLSLCGAGPQALADPRSEKQGVSVEVQQVETPAGTVCRYRVHNGGRQPVIWFGLGEAATRSPFMRSRVEPKPLAVQQAQTAPEGWSVSLEG